MHRGHYGQMFQPSLVLLLGFVVFGPLWSYLLLPALADVPCAPSQLPFCFSFILSCSDVPFQSSVFPLFSCLSPCCSPSAFPGDLLVSAPRCPSKWWYQPAGLKETSGVHLSLSLLNVGSALLMPFLQMSYIILKFPVTKTPQPLKVACSNA